MSCGSYYCTCCRKAKTAYALGYVHGYVNGYIDAAIGQPPTLPYWVNNTLHDYSSFIIEPAITPLPLPDLPKSYLQNGKHAPYCICNECLET